MTVTFKFSVARSWERYLVISATVSVLLFMSVLSDVKVKSLSKFITFAKDNYNKWTLNHLTDPRENTHLHIYAGWPSSRGVDVINTDQFETIAYYCYANPLAEGYGIQNAEIRINSYRAIHVNERNPSVDIAKRYPVFGNSRGKVLFVRGLGLKLVVSKLSIRKTFIKISLSCQLWNSQGSLRSNLVVIRDFRYIYDNKGTQVIERSKLDPSGEGVLFCMRRVFNPPPLSRVEFDWHVESEDQLSTIPLSSIPVNTTKWPFSISHDTGALRWSFIPKDIQNFLREGKSLVCSAGPYNTRYRFRKWTFEAASTTIAKPAAELALLHPNTVNVPVHTSDKGTFFLPLTFTGLTSDTTYTWIHNDKPLSPYDRHVAKGGQCYLSSSIYPICKGPFTSNYSVVMTARENEKSLQVTYNIRPFRRCIAEATEDTPSFVFAVSGTDVSFKCRFKDTYNGFHVRFSNLIEDPIYCMKKKVAVYRSKVSGVKVLVRKVSNGIDVAVRNTWYRDPHRVSKKSNRTSTFYLVVSPSLHRVNHQVIFITLPKPKFAGIKVEYEDKIAIISPVVLNENEILQEGAILKCNWRFDHITFEGFVKALGWRQDPHSCEIHVMAYIVANYKIISCAVRLENPFVGVKHRNRCIQTTSTKHIAVNTTGNPYEKICIKA